MHRSYPAYPDVRPRAKTPQMVSPSGASTKPVFWVLNKKVASLVYTYSTFEVFSLIAGRGRVFIARGSGMQIGLVLKNLAVVDWLVLG